MDEKEEEGEEDEGEKEEKEGEETSNSKVSFFHITIPHILRHVVYKQGTLHEIILLVLSVKY